MRKLLGKKLLTASLLAATLVFGLVGCGSGDTLSDDTDISDEKITDGDIEKDDDSQELKVLRLGCGAQDDEPNMDLAQIAYDQGILEEELNNIGYTLEVYPFVSTGPECNEALASGNLDAALYGDFPAFTCQSNGIDITVVALDNSKMQYGILTADKNIKEPKDLEGKKVIVMQGTVIQYFWEQYATANDIDTSKVEIINSADFQSLLSTGQADAYVSVLYSANYMESLGLGTVFDDGGDLENGYTSMVAVVRNEILEENPEIGVALNKALIRSYEAAVENPQELYDDLASSSISADIMATGYAFNPSLTHLDPKITEEHMTYFDKLNNWMYDNGIILEKVDLEKFVDTSYYDKAIAELEEQ